MVQVLVVDDNQDVRVLFARIFRHAGFDVLVAANGFEAQTYLTRNLPDVVVLDINMPGLSGLDVLRFVRDIEGDNHVIILVVTADHLAQGTKEAEMADLFLQKPVRATELITLTKRLIDGRTMQMDDAAE